MSKYIVRRILLAFPILILITLINFALMHLAPGDPIDFMIPPDQAVGLISITRSPGGLQYGQGGEDYQAFLRQRLGLDKPLPVQYFIWLKNLAQGNFGRSMITQTNVWQELGRRVPVTLQLTVFSLIVSLVLGLAIGILSALYQYSVFDVLATLLSFLFLSMPGFFFALVAIFFVALEWNLLPPGQMYTIGKQTDLVDRLRHLILPVAIMGLSGSAGFIRFARASMLDVMREDYVRTARAKGLTERIVMVRHAFRNALMPIVTLISYRLPVLFGGSVLFERVFGWPGIGVWAADAALSKDYPVMMATIFFTAVLTLTANLLADIAYAFVDPRVSYR